MLQVCGILLLLVVASRIAHLCKQPFRILYPPDLDRTRMCNQLVGVECTGGAYKDAIGVCAHELGDPQLALFLARLLEGGQGSLQQHLLSQELLPGHSMLPWPY